MLICLNDGEFVTGRASGAVDGIEIPEALRDVPDHLLRVVDGHLSLIDELRERVFHIDPHGRKRLTAGDDTQLLTCRFDDRLVLEDGLWRIETEADRKAAERVDLRARARKECQRRIEAVASLATQVNLARASLPKSEEAARKALFDWIDAMRSHWPVLAEDGIAPEDDAAWEACPPAALALAAKW